MAFFSVKYKDGEYQAFELSVNKEKKVFDSGDPVKDYYEFTKWLLFDSGLRRVSFSSSFDHFFFDHDKYREYFFDYESFEPCDYNEGFSLIGTRELNTFKLIKEYVKGVK